MGLIFGLRPIIQMYRHEEIAIEHFNYYAKVLICLLVFLRTIIICSDDCENDQVKQQRLSEVEGLI